MKLGLFSICILFLNFNFKAQVTSPEAIPTKDTIHSVRKATLLSAIIPGAGQIYNHTAMPKGKRNAFWKVPIIYAGLGATGYFVLQHNSAQKELKQEYKTRLAGNLGLEKYQDYDLQGISTLYTQHLNQRDLFIIGFGLVYLVQVIDATVEAHFVSFDISEDLSLNIRPKAFSYNQAGLGLTLSFK